MKVSVLPPDTLPAPQPVLFLSRRGVLRLKVDGDGRVAACPDCLGQLRLEVNRDRATCCLCCDGCRQAVSRFRLRSEDGS